MHDGYYEMVSIPYGKGKGQNWGGCVLFPVYLYQFPMGKVKQIISKIKDLKNRYQFPMGKVKERFNNLRNDLSMYQFPMGKVKNNILCSFYIIIGKYRFVNLIFAK